MSLRPPKDMSKFPPYSLPKLYGWHMLARGDIKETGKLYQFFGANWWDLLMNDKLPIHAGEIEVKTKDAHAVIFINMGKNPTMMTNKETGDVYNILPGKRSTVNNTFDKVATLVASNPENEMHLTKIGSIWLILLNVQELRSGEAMVKDSAIFEDFLLMTGVPDKEQYINTVGIENFDYVDTKGWKYVDTGTEVKSDFVELLLDQWEVVNPNKRSNAPVGIPKDVHWIWLRRDPTKQEFGDLKPTFYKFMKTWIDRNPEFTFNIWTDNPNFEVPRQFEGMIRVRGPEEIAGLIERLPDEVRANIKYLLKNHMNVGARSDTLRQAILYLEGGIYADVNDAMCMAPLEKMFQKFDFIIGMEPVVYVNNAIIASKKKHPIPQAMLVWLSHNAREFVEEWEQDYTDEEQDAKDDYIVSTTGPIAMTQVIFGVMKRSLSKLNHSLILPSAWVYPNYWIPETPGIWLKPVSIFSHWDGREYLK